MGTPKRAGSFALTPTQALDVFLRVRRGEAKAALAREYGVSRATIARYAEGPREEPQLLPCGTNGAYMRHLRKGEIPCNQCTAAHAQDLRMHRRELDQQPHDIEYYRVSRKRA